jgi:hypothetical protein
MPATTTSVGQTTTLSDESTFVPPGSRPTVTEVGALPQAIVQPSAHDDLRGLVFVDVAIAGTTAVAGVVLVRRGRVPFG